MTWGEDQRSEHDVIEKPTRSEHDLRHEVDRKNKVGKRAADQTTGLAWHLRIDREPSHQHEEIRCQQQELGHSVR